MEIINWEIGLSKFTQLGNDFEIQQYNWVRWCFSGDHRKKLFWNGSMTGKLMERMVQFSESASDSSTMICELDALQFNLLVGNKDHRLKPNTGLPDQYRAVYIAHVFNKIVLGGRVRYTGAGDIEHQCGLMGISKYRYGELLDRAIKMIKRNGGLV